MQLAETYSFRLQTEHAHEIYDFIIDVYKKLFGEKAVIISYVLQQKAESLIRQGSTRNKEPIERAMKLIE